MYSFLKRLLFLFDAETAHHLTMWCFNALLRIPGKAWFLKKIFSKQHPSLHRQIANLHFENPMGLAAGFDKNARYLRAMSLLGFSHIEVGTITPRPQTGNPKPRLFRLPASQALINRMGFNNDGVDVIAERLKKPRPQHLIVGANIGKNKDTPNEEAVTDYLRCFTILYDLVDYFTINVSSPNTPGLRELQDKEPLTYLLFTLQSHNPRHIPVFLKIAPDLTPSQLDDIIDIIFATKLTGVIASNTTISREGLKESSEVIESCGAGGLSGTPILAKSVSIVRYLKEKSEGRFYIIGVGGITDGSSAKKHLDAGADLVQVYTGLIYQGPGMVKSILKDL